MALMKNADRAGIHKHYYRMWPRALFHSKEGRQYLEQTLDGPGVYVLYRDGVPYYIGKTAKPLGRRLRSHALRPNTRRYNFWNYFSAFQVDDPEHQDEIEAILISAMPTANSARPKLHKTQLPKNICALLNNIQSMTLTGAPDRSGDPDITYGDEEEEG